MGTVHASINAVRAAVTGLQSALPSFVSGEERLIEDYDAAIQETDLSSTKELLLQQKHALQGRMRAMIAMQSEA